MKIYFIGDMLHAPQTGGEKYNTELIAGIRKAGIDIDEIDGGIYKGFAHSPIILNLILLTKILFIRRNALCLVDIGFCTRAILLLIGIITIKHCRITGILFHYNYPEKKDILRILHQFCESLVSRHCQALVTISKFDEAQFRRIAGNSAKVHIVPPPLKSDGREPVVSASFNPEFQRLLFVGNVEPRKNLLNTLKALKNLTMKYTFDIVGRFPDPAYELLIKNAAHDLGVGKNIVFHGRIAENELHSLFRKATIFVMVSQLEGYGMVYAEAMMYGLPIVATKRGAVPEIVIDGVNGILCDPESPQEISNAIQKLTNKEIWLEVSKANLLASSKFSTADEFQSTGSKIVQHIAFSQ